MTYKQFEEKFNLSRDKKQGPGKEYMLFLEKHRPDLANKVRNTDLDPFYKGVNLHKCQKFIEENWNVYEFQAQFRFKEKTHSLPVFTVTGVEDYKKAEEKAWNHYFDNYPHLRKDIWL